ncbi:SDR family NAD(P)-dependent oxidoreductase [Longimicrobium sp.]|uniref:SDR family NAD(P)-dependent oxidoreductase n=1 Tax=Longimicrobium sp. TaxID=2029185 RepID=UPI002E33173A|nr:SDR family NAD(P)-dependent oxidoreductase [Longimicrobium sp.]HEX6038585.1 SDR family NAD(P)-dependent oxidoreductase [Longimicrobium sp.]
MSNERLLEGRLAVVTGGGRGIGAAIADRLAAAGARVAVLGRDRDELMKRARALTDEHGVEAKFMACDVADEDAVARAFDGIRRTMGDPHILVNNAGQSAGVAFTETTRETWDRMIAVNLTGTFLCTQQVLPAMLSAGAGRVINIASTAGLKGYSHTAAYCAAKHGVIGMTRSLAMETAKKGITVNAVCPGYTDTDMAASAIRTLVDAGRTEEDARKAITRVMPIGRLIRPEEVASAVLWLCSDDAASVTGQSIAVAGGEVM